MSVDLWHLLAALRDVFHTLFHPSDRGAISARLGASGLVGRPTVGQPSTAARGPLRRGLDRVLDHLFTTLREQYGVPADREAALRYLAQDSVEA